jgi:2-C-methyl-D-erythritol 4-phosphate cytidylyltransferase
VSGAVAIVLAAGTGQRLGASIPKAFLPLGDETILTLAAMAAAACPEVESLVIAVPPGWERRAEALVPSSKRCAVVTGGPTRPDSVLLALRSVPGDADAVLCHDAARPFASPALFSAALAALRDADGVVPVVPVSDTVKRISEGMVVGTESRRHLALAQTPQAFRLEPLRLAHATAGGQEDATDDAALLERARYRVRAIPGEPLNFKITTAEDLALAGAVLAGLRGGGPEPAGMSEDP